MKTLIILLITLPVIACVFLYFAQNYLIFPRRAFDATLHEALRVKYPDSKQVLNTTDGIKLHGWCVEDKITKPSPLIVFFGGNADNAGYYALDKDRFPGFSFCGFNYRGYDLSEGMPSENSLVKDAVFIYDELLKKKAFDPERVIIMGRSLGTGIAIQLAAQRPSWKLLLISPYDSIVNVAKDAYPWAPIRMLIKHPFESYRYVNELDTQVMVVIAGEDRVVLPERSELLIPYFQKAPKLLRLEDYGHNNLFEAEQYWLEVNRFFND